MYIFNDHIAPNSDPYDVTPPRCIAVSGPFFVLAAIQDRCRVCRNVDSVLQRYVKYFRDHMLSCSSLGAWRPESSSRREADRHYKHSCGLVKWPSDSMLRSSDNGALKDDSRYFYRTEYSGARGGVGAEQIDFWNINPGQLGRDCGFSGIVTLCTLRIGFCGCR